MSEYKSPVPVQGFTRYKLQIAIGRTVTEETLDKGLVLLVPISHSVFNVISDTVLLYASHILNYTLRSSLRIHHLRVCSCAILSNFQ